MAGRKQKNLRERADRHAHGLRLKITTTYLSHSGRAHALHTSWTPHGHLYCFPPSMLFRGRAKSPAPPLPTRGSSRARRRLRSPPTDDGGVGSGSSSSSSHPSGEWQLLPLLEETDEDGDNADAPAVHRSSSRKQAHAPHVWLPKPQSPWPREGSLELLVVQETAILATPQGRRSRAAVLGFVRVSLRTAWD